MDYEKEYKSALERCRRQLENKKISKECATDLFRELEENEDERIRKWLSDILDATLWRNDWPYTKQQVINYLEKQKEEEGYEAIPVESTLEYKLGFKAGRDSEKQKEQKPVINGHKFHIGDTVTNGEDTYTINYIGNDCYWVKEHDCTTIPFEYEDRWKLIEQKSAEIDNEEIELSDFECELFSAFSDGWQQYLCGEEVDVKQWAKEHSAQLLNSAKQELQPAEWSYPYGRNETVDRLVAIAECLEMDGDCLFNGYPGTECGKFLRELARKQVECKPAEWSEEDEDFINMLILHFNYLIDKGGDNVEAYKSYREKLKSLRPQPKRDVLPSLSEKEIICLKRTLDYLRKEHNRYGGVDFTNEIAELEWLITHPILVSDTHWKPSEGQIEALERAVSWYSDTKQCDTVLYSLLSDLKKQYETESKNEW